MNFRASDTAKSEKRELKQSHDKKRENRDGVINRVSGSNIRNALCSINVFNELNKSSELSNCTSEMSIVNESNANQGIYGVNSIQTNVHHMHMRSLINNYQKTERKNFQSGTFLYNLSL